MGSLDVVIKDSSTTVTLKATAWSNDNSTELKTKGFANRSGAEEGATAIDAKKSISQWTVTATFDSLSAWKTARDNLFTIKNSGTDKKLQIGSTPTINVKIMIIRINSRSTENVGGDNNIIMDIVVTEGEAFKLF